MMGISKRISEIFDNKIYIEVWEWISAILVAVVAALLINVFIFELYTVKQTSMWPTFQDGDQIIAWKAGQLFNSIPDYGDVIIVDSNVERTRGIVDEFKDSALISRVNRTINEDIWIKRVIGRPGDLLEFKDNQVYRNGELLNEDYIIETMKDSFESIIVPENHVYVMGDNRNNSRDSRLIGPIPIENVRGKVILRFYPIKQVTKF